MPSLNPLLPISFLFSFHKPKPRKILITPAHVYKPAHLILYGPSQSIPISVHSNQRPDFFITNSNVFLKLVIDANSSDFNVTYANFDSNLSINLNTTINANIDLIHIVF